MALSHRVRRSGQTGCSSGLHVSAAVSHSGLEQSMSELFSFGAWVRRRRRALDLTRDELAAQVGCSVVTLRFIEADERRPSKQLAARLADGLQLSPEERPAFVQAARG